MDVKVNQSKKQVLCIIYHPNPVAIQETIEKVKALLAEVK